MTESVSPLQRVMFYQRIREKYESESDLSASFHLACTKDLRKKLLWYIFAREEERRCIGKQFLEYC